MAKEAAVIGIKKHQMIVNAYEDQLKELRKEINYKASLISDLGVEIGNWQGMNKSLQQDAEEHLKTLTDLKDEIATTHTENTKVFNDAKVTIDLLCSERDKWKKIAESFRAQDLETQQKLYILQQSKWYHLLFGIKPKVKNALTKEEIMYLQAEHEDIKSGLKDI